MASSANLFLMRKRTDSACIMIQGERKRKKEKSMYKSMYEIILLKRKRFCPYFILLWEAHSLPDALKRCKFLFIFIVPSLSILGSLAVVQPKS